jgi:hypothetical protein
MTGQSLETGVIQEYLLDLSENSTVTCSTTGNNGDADLYLRFGATPEANPNSTVNECGSYSATSTESCTTTASGGPETLHAAVHAYGGFTDLTITCTSSAVGQCTLAPVGGSCRSGSDCCSGVCSGGRPSSRVCLAN